MIRRIILSILITGLLAKNYLIETAEKDVDNGRDKGKEEVGEKGGSDYSLLPAVKMVLSGQFDADSPSQHEFLRISFL